MTAEKIEDRIRKLLALAGQQDNANEAAVAFAQAQRLATMHDLDLDELLMPRQEEPPAAREVGQIIKLAIDSWDRVVAWRLTVAGAVARSNNCRTFYRSGRGGGVTAYGRQHDLDVVLRMHHEICNVGEALARAAVAAYRADPELDPRFDDSPRVFGRNFRIGFASAIAQRLPSPEEVLNDARTEAAQQWKALGSAEPTTALVRVQNAANYLGRVRYRLDEAEASYGLGRGREHGGLGGRGSGYAAGRRAGASVNLGGRKALRS